MTRGFIFSQGLNQKEVSDHLVGGDQYVDHISHTMSYHKPYHMELN